MEFLEDVQLASYTTFQIGGPARWFAEAHSEEDLLEAVSFARERELPLFILGGGSNLLVSDDGFNGLVLRIASSGIEEAAAPEGIRIFSVAAGENWDAFVSFAVSQNCGGIECLAGIPGTVGGTPIQNVGAYGQEVSSTIMRVRVLDLHTNNFEELSAADCRFAYRRSIFNTTQRSRYVVSRVEFRLQTAAQPMLQYADLKQRFKDGVQTLRDVAAAVREIRDAKGMLLVDGEPDCRSAGSFFKNPVVLESVLETIASDLAINPEAIPRYPAADGKVKLPAAWLLEQAGFYKGYVLGPAALSNRHTLAITNRGGAKASDILVLRDRITQTIKARFGIHLEQEPIVL